MSIPPVTRLSYHLSICPSARSFTFSGFWAFADKSLGRSSIKFGMLMHRDNLLSPDIDADGYCCHFIRLSVCPTVCELGFWHCGQIFWKKSLHFGMRMYPEDLFSVYWCIWVLFSVRPFVTHVFRFLCICWQITWKEWYKVWHADVSRWLTPSRHRCRWVLLSFHAFVRPSVQLSVSLCFDIADKSLGRKSLHFYVDVSRWLTLSLSTLMGIIDRPSVRSSYFKGSVHLLTNNLVGMA